LRITGSLNLRSPSYPTSGSLVRIDDTRTHIFVRPSGSNTSGNIQLYDAGDSRSILIINASQTSIGSEATSNAFGNNNAQNYFRGNTQFFQNITSSANIQAVSFIGDGSGLTNIPGVTPIETGSFATTGSNVFVGDQIITGSFTAKSGSGVLTSSVSFIHNTISPSQGSSVFEVRHINNVVENFAVKLFADDYIAKMQYEKDGTTYDLLRTNLAGDLHLTQNTRLLDTDLRIDGTLKLTGSLSSAASANFLGNVTASIFTGSFVGDGSGLTNIPGVTPIETGSFATTGSNQFNSGQSISGSLRVSGSISQVGIGAGNTFLGFNSGTCRTTGTCNTFFGNEAGCRVTTGACNTMIGHRAGACNIQGFDNTVVGFQAGIGTTGCASTSNTVVGACAGKAGSHNTVLGIQAAYDMNGQFNTVLGSYAHRGGNSNCTIAVGACAGTRITGLGTADCSIFIGICTGAPASGQCNQIVIGHCAIGNGSNTVTLGNSNITQTHLRGFVTGSSFRANSFTGSFFGDGSGLTGIPGATPIETGSFATTGSNVFNGNQIISSSLLVTDKIESTGSLILKPDVNSPRYLEVYNTAPTDTHITASGGQIFIGDDTTYVKVDNYSNFNRIDIVANSGVYVSGSTAITGSLIVSGSTNINGIITYPEVSASFNFADDTAASGGGVPLGGLYHTSGALKIRLA
jgi:hypothetical protein